MPFCSASRRQHSPSLVRSLNDMLSSPTLEGQSNIHVKSLGPEISVSLVFVVECRESGCHGLSSLFLERTAFLWMSSVPQRKKPRTSERFPHINAVILSKRNPTLSLSEFSKQMFAIVSRHVTLPRSTIITNHGQTFSYLTYIAVKVQSTCFGPKKLTTAWIFETIFCITGDCLRDNLWG